MDGKTHHCLILGTKEPDKYGEYWLHGKGFFLNLEKIFILPHPGKRYLYFVNLEKYLYFLNLEKIFIFPSTWKNISIAENVEKLVYEGNCAWELLREIRKIRAEEEKLKEF